MKVEKQTFRQLVYILPIIEKEPFTRSLKNLIKPISLCGVKVPEHLTLEQFGGKDGIIDLQTEYKDDPTSLTYRFAKIVLGLNEKKVGRAYADDVVGFMKFCSDEIGRLTNGEINIDYNLLNNKKLWQ